MATYGHGDGYESAYDGYDAGNDGDDAYAGNDARPGCPSHDGNDATWASTWASFRREGWIWRKRDGPRRQGWGMRMGGHFEYFDLDDPGNSRQMLDYGDI